MRPPERASRALLHFRHRRVGLLVWPQPRSLADTISRLVSSRLDGPVLIFLVFRLRTPQGTTTSSVVLTNEENKDGFAWGTASRQTSIETYVATNDRSLPPQDQIIGTEKVNVLLKHFYGMGEAQRGAGKLDMVGKAKGKKRQNQVQPTATGRTQKKRK